MRHMGAEPAQRVVRDVGDHVGVAEDPVQCLAGARYHPPTDLMSVSGGDHAGRAGPLRCAAQQAERCGGAEPHGLDASIADQLLHAPAHVRGW